MALGSSRCCNIQEPKQRRWLSAGGATILSIVLSRCPPTRFCYLDEQRVLPIFQSYFRRRGVLQQMKPYSRIIVVLFGGAFAVVAINSWLIMTGRYRWPLAVLVAYLVGAPLIIRKFPFVAKDSSEKYQLKAAISARRLGWSAKSRRMASNLIILHSTLAPETVADTLLRSIDEEIELQSVMPWFVRLVWSGGSRQVRGLIDGNKFRLKRRNAWQWSPNFYGKWEPDHSGTRIEGYFDLTPMVRRSLRFTLITMIALAVIGILLNTLDLTAGTHFTVDPYVGLGISIFCVLFSLAIYVLALKLGSRHDESLLDFLEQTLAASPVP